MSRGICRTSVLPASRLTHSHDLFSNRVACFEVSEPHSYLSVKAQSWVSTHPPAPLPVAEKLCWALKISARYVSGYLATETANATHAWVAVFIPGHGWRGLDPTHNRQIGETYVKIGYGQDYADVSPISGHYHGTRERRMIVEVKIKPVI